MDKRIAGLLGAAAALTAVGTAHATTTRANDLQTPTSYRDLLEPVPNALALLKADDSLRAQDLPSGDVQLAQYHHHHHHHHVIRRPFRPFFRYHHHHHRYHHHHHHH